MPGIDEDLFPQGIKPADPSQVPTTLKEPAMEAGQPPASRAAVKEDPSDVAVASLELETRLQQDESKKQQLGPARQFAGVPMAPIRTIEVFNTNTLLYGRPGSGKTFLTATAQLSKHMAPMMYVSCEAGSSTIRQVSADIMILPDPTVAGSVTWEQFEAIYDELDRQCYNTKDGPEFRTVAVDTGTELQKINMEWVMKQTLAAHPDRDPDVPGLHDWGKSSNRMRTVIRRFRDLPMNFIFVCHEQEDRDNRGLLWKKPDLPGKLTNQAAAFFDQVMYLYTKQVSEGDETSASNIKRVLMTGALEGYVTKDRSGKLPLLMVDPSMDKIFSLITGS